MANRIIVSRQQTKTNILHFLFSEVATWGMSKSGLNLSQDNKSLLSMWVFQQTLPSLCSCWIPGGCKNYYTNKDYPRALYQMQYFPEKGKDRYFSETKIAPSLDIKGFSS